MTTYDTHYKTETDMFGSPYREFEDFIQLHAVKGGQALDLGCGQGRDAIMLARHGYQVTGVDTSKVGIQQMINNAKTADLNVNGIVGNFHEFTLNELYDAIVLDSILHFEENDRQKELVLLNNLEQHLTHKGFMFIFVHKSDKKEEELQQWLVAQSTSLSLAKECYINYIYEEKSIGFKSEFQMYMFIVQKKTHP